MPDFYTIKNGGETGSIKALLYMKNKVNIKALTLEVDMFGAQSKIHPTLIWDDTGATLVDVGFPGQFEQLLQAVTQAGVSFSQVRRVIITHQDWDHIGTLPEIIKATNGTVELYAHVNEKPYLEGTLPYLKISPEKIAARLQSIPAEMREKAAAIFANIPTIPINQTLVDGDKLPFHGGIEIIHTPGHTPGHVCLYLKSHRLLIAGDQLRLENGHLVGPAEIHTPDMMTAMNSLEKLTSYDIDRVICYHGGISEINASIRIAELASTGETLATSK
jgi:glyoxylase-like metal-dependent hydrolase (beta-lactamase superfamily II)